MLHNIYTFKWLLSLGTPLIDSWQGCGIVAQSYYICL